MEHAQQMAAHESPRITKLYDRTKDEITIGEVERIQLWVPKGVAIPASRKFDVLKQFIGAFYALW